MRKILSVEFRYNQKEYFAIARYRKRRCGETYLVRIMNHKLDSIIATDNMNLIEIQQGSLVPAQAPASAEAQEIIDAIVQRLKECEGEE